jgi:hypothetical protein
MHNIERDYNTYWATCHSSLSAHSFFLSVNKTSETSLAPFPLRQLIVSNGFVVYLKKGGIEKEVTKTYMTIS